MKTRICIVTTSVPRVRQGRPDLQVLQDHPVHRVQQARQVLQARRELRDFQGFPVHQDHQAPPAPRVRWDLLARRVDHPDPPEPQVPLAPPVP